jgi:hypothetical protein
MSTKMGPEYCDECGEELEEGQIGLCGDCQDAVDTDRMCDYINDNDKMFRARAAKAGGESPMKHTLLILLVSLLVLSNLLWVAQYHALDQAYMQEEGLRDEAVTLLRAQQGCQP